MKPTVKIIIAAILIPLTFFFCWYFKSIIVYILIAAVLSFIGRPLISLLSKVNIKGVKLPEGLKAGITLFTLWFVILGFFRILVPLISSEAKELSNINVTQAVSQLEEPINKIENIVKKISVGNDFNLQTYVTEKISSLVEISQVKNLFGSLASTIGDILMGIFSISFISFFFLKDRTLFQKIILLTLPPKHEDAVRKALESIQKLLVRYFVGILIEVLLVMLLNIIGHSVFVGIGFSHAVMIGLFAGLMNVIPYIGPIIGTIFGLIIGTAINIHLDFYTELLPILGYMTIVFMTIQLLDNIVFQPLIYGNSVHAHPLEIFIIILTAGSIAGIPGMVLAIPSYTVLRVVAKEFFNKYPLINKITQSLE